VIEKNDVSAGDPNTFQNSDHQSMQEMPRHISVHPKEAAMMKSMPLPNSPALMMALIGPVIGIISGIIIGLLAYVTGKFVKPQSDVLAP
jgi:thiamine transporter ThiT